MIGRSPTAAFVAVLALLPPLAQAQDSGIGFITSCRPGYFGLTFDDGPSMHTGRLLDSLRAAQVKVTFFIQGDQITPETGAFTKRAFEEGHQIGSHTWDHKSLNSLAVDKIQQEMTMNEEAIKNVTGIIPNYMRPPFGDCNERCASTLAAMGYHVVQWNIDSNDWRYEEDPNSWFRVSEDVLKLEDVNTTVTKNDQLGYISLQHDTLPYSVDQVPQIIEKIKALGLQIAPIEQCIDNPPAPMYRGGKFSNETVPPAATPVPAAPAQPGPAPVSPAGQTSMSTSAQPTAAAPAATHPRTVVATFAALGAVGLVVALAS